ncbi:MAG: D-alanyl-D-alanine carboxypeptidase/D-alanyl-D-alanine-endopeptidase [Proteobacteria bacterium]|nr:D-alanyl-D-alanine carboxypeptidase/D-alanyl-D-alanine-endopeptidase [Pseudomonadota bacterium]
MLLARRGAITTIAAAFVALAVAGFGIGAAGAAGPAGSPVPPPRPDRSAQLAVAPAPAQRHSGASGWIVIDLDSGEVIDQHLADTPFAPASVAKLPTTLYALDRLGPEHRFETRVAIAGELRGGTLEGDLILIGGGDPELDTDDLLVLVSQVAEHGLRRLGGRFLVDGSAGPRLAEIDSGQPVDAAYNPSLSGLNLNFNRVRLKWDARGAAQTLRVSAKANRLDPEVAGVRVVLASTPGAPMFSHALIGRAEVWRMSPSGFRGKGARWLPVRRPELYAGEVFQSLAEANGVILDPAQMGPAPEGAGVIARHQSRPLRSMLRGMLRYSTNLTAELAGLAASRAGGVEPATLAASAAAMNAWAAEAAGFTPGDPGFRLVNHSGLSTTSRVSPRRLVELLAAMARRQAEPNKRHPRLPGGLTDLLRDYNVAARSIALDTSHLDIVAKTGTMDYVRGLAGFIATPSGRRLVFAIFSNDLERRVEGARRIDRRWMARARVFERSLIRHWVRRLEG